MQFSYEWYKNAYGKTYEALMDLREEIAQLRAVCRYLRVEVERLEGENNEMRIWLYANKVKWPREVSNVQT